MAKALNFNTIKKNYFTVTLPDGGNTADGKPTVLQVATPTKRILDEITAMQRLIDRVTDDTEADTVEILYSVCADILSNNRTGRTVDVDYLADIFDLASVVLLYTHYCDFIAEETTAKN